jgi:hypothetical protein
MTQLIFKSRGYHPETGLSEWEIRRRDGQPLILGSDDELQALFLKAAQGSGRDAEMKIMLRRPACVVVAMTPGLKGWVRTRLCSALEESL